MILHDTLNYKAFIIIKLINIKPLNFDICVNLAFFIFLNYNNIPIIVCDITTPTKELTPLGNIKELSQMNGNFPTQISTISRSRDCNLDECKVSGVGVKGRWRSLCTWA